MHSPDSASPVVETREVHPATYPSAWQCNEDGTAELMTAEDWLDEEANVYEMNGDDPADPNRVQITRAIAEEIRHLRVSRSWWRTEHDHLLGKFASVQRALAEKDRQLHEAESTKADWRGAAKDATKRADELHVELAARTAERDALREALRDIRDNYDHEEQTHSHQPFKYGGRCRCCTAGTALAASRADASAGEATTRDMTKAEREFVCEVNRPFGTVVGHFVPVAPAGGEATPSEPRGFSIVDAESGEHWDFEVDRVHPNSMRMDMHMGGGIGGMSRKNPELLAVLRKALWEAPSGAVNAAEQTKNSAGEATPLLDYAKERFGAVPGEPAGGETP